MSLKDRVKAVTVSEETVEDSGAAADEAQDPAGAAGEQQTDGNGDGEGPGGDIAARDPQMQWLRQYGGYFDDALPRHIDQGYFLASARAVLPKLKNCTNASIVQALLACARFGLMPDGKQAAIVPYRKVATFIPMYQGYIDLMYRSGRIDSVHFGWIHEKDEWEYTPTAPAPLDFTCRPRVDLPKHARGPVILAYAFCWIKGGGRSQVVILNRYDAEEIRNEHSKSYLKAEREKTFDSAWHTDFDAMWAKSAVRRLEKVVPTSPELTELIKADDAGDAGHLPVSYIVARADEDDDQGDTDGQGEDPDGGVE